MSARERETPADDATQTARPNLAGKTGRPSGTDHRRALMPARAKYGAKFVGYSAYVIARKYGRDVYYAQLDFVCGAVFMLADGGWVGVQCRSDLGPFLKTLPELANELRHLLCHGAAQVPDNIISMTRGQSTVGIAPGTDVSRFIREITKRFAEIERLLEQVEETGLRIKRRPYSEYIDDIGKTGISRVEVHGLGLFVDGKLIFYPTNQVLSTRK